MKNVTDVVNIGVNDHEVDLFEGLYVVPNGVSYNSYVILDEKIAVLDTVDAHFGDEWLANLEKALGGKKPDYLVVLHMEPDHSANIARFARAYPETVIVGNAKTFAMMSAYFGAEFDKLTSDRKLTVAEGDVLELGKHKLSFVFAPMVHWPEVMVAYDSFDKALYSADAFGKFGALDVDEPWDDEARRYYIGIVGKYGVQVQALFKKAAALDIKIIRPLHGPILSGDLSHYFDLYTKWSTYTPEIDGVLVAYTSVYGHTATAAKLLAAELEKLGVPHALRDLARDDRAQAIAEAFKYGKAVFATTTYNNEAFPAMREFLDGLAERNYQNRKIAYIENGSWAPSAAKHMAARLEKCKGLELVDTVTVRSAMTDADEHKIKTLAKVLAE